MRPAALLLAVAACAAEGPATDTLGRELPDFEPPVATNAEPAVRYPPALFDQGVEGTVLLRLFVDAGGRVVPESTRVAEGSGQPALDSAALAAVPRMTFAPARRRGIPVPSAFMQPVYFRHPEARGGTS